VCTGCEKSDNVTVYYYTCRNCTDDVCRYDAGDFALSWTDFGILLIIGILLLVRLEAKRRRRMTDHRPLVLEEQVFIAYRLGHAIVGHLLAAIAGIIHQYYMGSTATVLTHSCILYCGAFM